MPVPKRLKKVFALAVENGWTVTETKKGYPGLIPPPGTVDHEGRPVTLVKFAKTPSDARSDANGLAQLRRLGLNVAHKGHTESKKQRHDRKR
ncbi:hypothetical protein [Dietzia sp. 179-F 9C3 NHS]|uniref:hypothetical protein n=1 Tax=Dietzia sp. 179-F 9C3 NHS TaxID=3374295 RepID=UPI0038799D9A